MDAFTCENDMAHSAASKFLDKNIRFLELGINFNESLVLAALVEVACVIPGEPSAAISRYELADRIKVLSWSQVQRALTSLAKRGLIARRQNAKVSGDIAVTVVSEAAYKLFGLSGGAKIGREGLPVEFADLIVGESEATIEAIAHAFKNSECLPSSVCAEFRGAGRRLAQIEFLLSSQISSLQMAAYATAEEIRTEQEEEAAGIYALDLSNGERLVFDQNRLRAGAENGDVAVRSADIRFARDVLERIDQRNPRKINSINAASLAAEILFSRQKGFVWSHGYNDACRVLASVMTRGDWRQPRKITSDWYRMVKPSIRQVEGVLN